MNILAIETSCDDTSISILKDEKVISFFVLSQTKKHNKYGGVIPEYASRIHTSKIHGLIQDAIDDSGIKFSDLNSIVVTIGPGLIGTLQVGLIVAKTLSLMLNIPFYKVNHLDAHLYSPFIGKKRDEIPSEAIFLIISGGHTIIGKKINNKLTILGETRDDSIGESYDKVAKILNLSQYPGGPIIDEKFGFLDKKNFKHLKKVPITNLEKYDFSYSGLKSWVNQNINNFSIDEIIYLFQRSAMEQIILKIKKAIDEFNIKNVIIAGGVSANMYLRNKISKIEGLNIFFPKLIYSGDNAAMIGYYFYLFNHLMEKCEYNLDVKPRLKLGEI